MNKEENYIEINKKSWNAATPYNVDSEFYNMPAFLEGKSSLNEIELKLLGDVRNKRILHLQCHFGQDSISLARMGATVTGVDFSDKAISKAEEIACLTGVDATFVCCDVYSLRDYLEGEFDIVFTSYGTIGWLPDLGKWAKIISDYLKPSGYFVFAEFHPVVWMFNEDLSQITYSYFNERAIIETAEGTYAAKSAPISNEIISWNHNIGEVLSSLISNGLEITSFEEYDYSPYNCFNNMLEQEPGRFRINGFKSMLPLVYSLKATKKEYLRHLTYTA